MRTGLLARKVGMTSIFNEKGEKLGVTILSVENCKVLYNRTLEKNGYTAIAVGASDTKISKIKKPNKHIFNDIEPKRFIKEFRVTQENLLDVGAQLLPDHFKVGQFVDVSGLTIGKGFAGPMKRHNFRGLEASHGVSVSHRSHGSTGGRQDPGKVFKNKKMAGHMGQTMITMHNLQVISVDIERSLIIVKGSVPGHQGVMLEIRDAIKKTVS